MPTWSKTRVAKCDLKPISSNSTVAHALLQKIHLKQQIELSLDSNFLHFVVAHIVLHKNGNESKTRVAKSKLTHAVLHKFYLKQQIEVPWILLTKPSHLGKFKVARCFSQGSGKFTVAHPFSYKLYVTQWEYFFRLLFSLGFWQTTQISSNSDLRTLFYTNLENLKMSATFLT